jgi:hypothetical protein
MATKTVRSTANPRITKTKLYSGTDDAVEIVVPEDDVVCGLATTVNVTVRQAIITSMLIVIFVLPLTL